MQAIEANTTKLRADLDGMEDVDAGIERDFKELEARTHQLSRKLDSLDDGGEGAWNDAETTVKTSMDRLKEDVDRFQEKFDDDES